MVALDINIESLLAPIAGDAPAGQDLRYTDLWVDIKEARRADETWDDRDVGQRELKVANWSLVARLTSKALAEQSKDLQLSAWLTEAWVHLSGFEGLAFGLDVTAELLKRFWECGLYPELDGDDTGFRAGVIEWLNLKLPEAVIAIPVTHSQRENYSWHDRSRLQATGLQDSWEDAIKKTDTSFYKAAACNAENARTALNELEAIVRDKFNVDAPETSQLANAILDYRNFFVAILEGRSRPGAAAATLNPEESTDLDVARTEPGGINVRFDYPKINKLIRSGRTSDALRELRGFAEIQESGRDRFHLRLLIAETCIALKRTNIARILLEELSEQIEYFHVDQWESPKLAARVWSLLRVCYREIGPATSESEADTALLKRLCRSDPMQALDCD